MSEIYAHDAPGPHLIRGGRLEADTSRPFVPEPEVAAEGQVPGDEPGWIVPLAVWKTSRATLRRHRHPVAILLEPDADLRELADADGVLDPAGIAFIAVDFPVYTDGRGYSLARAMAASLKKIRTRAPRAGHAHEPGALRPRRLQRRCRYPA